jgi:hypothetical protein
VQSESGGVGSKEVGNVAKITLWRLDASSVAMETQQHTSFPLLLYILRLRIFCGDLIVAGKN